MSKSGVLVSGLVIAGLLVSGCAGRDAHPIAASQPQDNSASCSSIQAELDANNLRMAQLSREEGWKVAQNVGAAVVGVFTLGIGFAAMDFKDAAGTERDALETRNRYLAQIAAERCRTPAY